MSKDKVVEIYSKDPAVRKFCVQARNYSPADVFALPDIPQLGKPWPDGGVVGRREAFQDDDDLWTVVCERGEQPPPKKKIVLVGPHTGSMVPLAAKTLHATFSQDPEISVHLFPSGSTLLTLNFNTLWCEALNLYEQGEATHFAMIHSDIGPDDWWLDDMLRIMDAKQCDILSAVVPIKDHRGLTSTAIGNPADEWHKRRLTLHEVHQLPPTFSARDVWQMCPQHEGWPLLHNTGLMLVRLGEWSRDFHFEFRDRIVRKAGKWHAENVPEDWGFGWWAYHRKLTVYCTREIGVAHVGQYAYQNGRAWGEWKTDRQSLGEEA